MVYMNNPNNFFCEENNKRESIPIKSEVNGSIRFHNKNKSKNNIHENVRSSSINRREYKNSNKCYETNNNENLESINSRYIDEILRIDGYIQHPYSINNIYDKKKWEKAHYLRNRMKEYDLITRKKLYENNSINKKAKFDRESNIILNRIPVFREAFPVAKEPSDKNKEAIIRTYLKTHVVHLLSESKNYKNHIRKKKKYNNSLNEFDQINYPFNFKSGNYKSDNRKSSENCRKKKLSYNLQEKSNEKIKNRTLTPHRNKNSKNCKIPLNCVNNKLNNKNERSNFNRDSYRYFSCTPNSSNKIHLNIQNFPKNLFNLNEKRQKSYENSNITKINMFNPNKYRNTYIYDYSDECKNTNINENSERNTCNETNSDDQFSNQSNYTNEYLTSSSNSSKSCFKKDKLTNENNIFKRDRYSLLGKIKNNKDVKVKLFLNKV